jgi:hypothetical protein
MSTETLVPVSDFTLHRARYGYRIGHTSLYLIRYSTLGWELCVHSVDNGDYEKACLRQHAEWTIKHGFGIMKWPTRRALLETIKSIHESDPLLEPQQSAPVRCYMISKGHYQVTGSSVQARYDPHYLYGRWHVGNPCCPNRRLVRRLALITEDLVADIETCFCHVTK